MDKRYQIFVSSTFEELKAERRAVFDTILDKGHIPTGMEFFPAAGDVPWHIIKRVISRCDYCLVIVAGAYGSITDEGISYTEQEYNYAIEQNVHVLPFLRKDSSVPADHPDAVDAVRKKLLAFRKRLEQGHTRESWDTVGDLKYRVSISLDDFFGRNPAEGWIRAHHLHESEERYKRLAEQYEQLKRSAVFPDREVSVADELTYFQIRFILKNSSATEKQPAELPCASSCENPKEAEEVRQLVDDKFVYERLHKNSYWIYPTSFGFTVLEEVVARVVIDLACMDFEAGKRHGKDDFARRLRVERSLLYKVASKLAKKDILEIDNENRLKVLPGGRELIRRQSYKLYSRIARQRTAAY